jgi:hypothetical protein
MLHLSSICKNQLLSGIRAKILHVIDISVTQCDKMWEVLPDADNETEAEMVVLGCNHRCNLTLWFAWPYETRSFRRTGAHQTVVSLFIKVFSCVIIYIYIRLNHVLHYGRAS